MIMDRNSEFLDLYRKLEMYLDGKYPYAESSIKEYIHKLEKSMVNKDKEKAAIIDFLRTTRNHMVHRNVSDYIDVTNKTIEFLNKEISEFENPILAQDIMTRISDVYYVNLDTKTTDVLNEIYQHSYDIVPVLNNKNQVLGVFSLDVILNSIYQGEVDKIQKGASIDSFGELISLNNQTKEKFAFVSSDTPLDELVELFSKKEEKKLVMIFVTRDGLKISPLLGIITPHDIINSKD